MGLHDLHNLRLRGKAPAIVLVIVGDAPRLVLDEPNVVRISPGDDPRRMDLRPLVGLHVDLYELGDHDELFEAAALAIDSAGPRSTGLASRHGFSGINDEYQRLLRRTWELLCN